MNKPILIVEDDPSQQHMLATLLRRKMEYGSQTADHGRMALDILEQDHSASIKLIILDLEMPVMGGLETLDIIKQRYPHLPVIMLTGSKDVDHIVTAMKRGATDFVTKPYDADRILITIKNALKISLLSQEVERLKNTKDGTFRFSNLIGHDKGLSNIITYAQKAAKSDIPVLITGETGTGKEVFAQAIHGESTRSGKPFIAINCGAIPSQLVESTLFGHEKGAFTGATEKTIGKFREADGGTIFLDEVGELPLDTQVKLLRVVQQKEVEPVGASKPIPINVRILSATNRDMQADVQKGNFREDLFFRLNVLHIELPSLHERREDILDLAEHFINRFAANQGLPLKTLSHQSIQRMKEYSWPGNVRELENTINRSMVMSEGNSLEIYKRTNTTSLNDAEEIHKEAHKHLHISLLSRNGEFKTAKEIETEAINIALRHFENNVTQSAKALGIAKSTFYKKIPKEHR